MDKFLTLRHWQLFILILGVPIIFQIITMVLLMSGGDYASMQYLFSIVMILYMSTFCGWFYALGTNLHKKLPLTAPMNLTRFKIFLIIPIVYILIFSLFLTEIPVEIIPLHLFSMFCLFYCMYFNAKALKAVELQTPVTFSDFSGEFFLLWMFPIGIWTIQPRVNKLFDTNLEDQTAIFEKHNQ